METRSEQARALVTAPIGELDLTAAGPLLDLLLELTASEPELLVIDLRSLSFMDCAGVRVLFDTQARARQAELPLSVICAPGQVRRLLALAHADQQLNLAEDPGQPHATPRGAATS